MEEPTEREVPGLIQNNETLGREERSRRTARRAYRILKNNGEAQADVAKFEPPKDTNEISVNRMDFASKELLAELGINNSRKLGKNFWGWYTLTVDEIKAVGCSINASPFEGNPYHADIVVPVTQNVEDHRDAITEYARELAFHAKFHPWGDWTNQIT